MKEFSFREGDGGYYVNKLTPPVTWVLDVSDCRSPLLAVGFSGCQRRGEIWLIRVYGFLF